MSKRHKIPARQSKRLFSQTAQSIHPKNAPKNPMRGGYRI